MCGICGVFGAGDRAVVDTMLDTLRHRGPDDSISSSGTDFAIGARRLSIVDVAGGRQPLTNEDGTVIAAQNGELYNFPDAARRCSNAVTSSPREPTRRSCRICGRNTGRPFRQHIDGMFAVAVWDSRRHVGLLARDRMGKKPLYYWQQGGTLYFASELKAILAIPGFERRLNLEALHHFLSYKHVPHPAHDLRGRADAAARTSARLPAGTDPAVSRYWRLSFAPVNGAVPTNTSSSMSC